MSVIAKTRILVKKKIYKPGELITELSEAEEEILIKQRAAEKNKFETATISKNHEKSLKDDLFPGANVKETDSFMTEDELKKMTKQKLVEYAESIGLEGLDARDKLDSLVSDILNFMEESEDE
ncbi:MAG: hypothetical protein ACERKN_07125 [Velocimicrobium sp.]